MCAGFEMPSLTFLQHISEFSTSVLDPDWSSAAKAAATSVEAVATDLQVKEMIALLHDGVGMREASMRTGVPIEGLRRHPLWSAVPDLKRWGWLVASAEAQ